MTLSKLSPFIYHTFVRPKWITQQYIHRHVRDILSDGQPFVLDFGCGTGANCAVAASDRYVGVDPDAKRVAYANKIYPDYIFRVMNEEGLPVDDHSIDTIIIIAVLHHIDCDGIRRYIKEFRRVLKPGGNILVMEPCLIPGNPVRNRIMKMLDRGAHLRFEDQYKGFFAEQNYECTVLKRFMKCLLYNELFFMATT